MALDTSMYGNLLGRPVRSIDDWTAHYQAKDDAQQARSLNALAMQLKQGELDAFRAKQADDAAIRSEQNALSSLLAKADPNAPDFATQAYRVAPRAAGTFLNGWNDQAESAAKVRKEGRLAEKAAAETDFEKLKTAKDRIGLIYNAAAGAKDQASYTMALQGLQAQGIDTSGIPAQFDPAYVQQAKVQALTEAQRLDQAMKASEFRLKANNELIGHDGKVNQTLLGAKESIARSGASNVNISTGQKGLDNEFKLRGEFKQEPVYKAYQEMQAAHGQIKQAIAQASPAGDLAAATKIMKLLDPGSVVRESELGMAMQASGLMDRITNYGNMVITGQKLTPTQRKDFASLADRLMGESVKAYNGKRAEYDRIGGEYGLNSGRALGPAAPAVSPAAGADGWSITPKATPGAK